MNTEKLPETYVIFITENDVLGADKAVYHIDRIVAETDNPFGDMAHIVYVNNHYRGNDPIGTLMHDFACRNTAEMKNGILAARAKMIKTDDDKVEKMSYIVEELVKEEREDALKTGRTEGRIETAIQLLRQGIMSEERVQDFFHFTPEQMAVVKGQSEGINIANI